MENISNKNENERISAKNSDPDQKNNLLNPQENFIKDASIYEGISQELLSFIKKFIPLLFVVILASSFVLKTLVFDKKIIAEDPEVRLVKRDIKLPNFSLPELSSDNNFSKKDLIGKYSIINFFASWCVNCKAEHEFFMRLKEKNIIDIYGIAMKDREESTKRFLINSGNPYKKIGKDAEGAFSKSLNVEAIPETWIVDKEGNVIMKTKYNFDMKTIIEIISFINLKNESSK